MSSTDVVCFTLPFPSPPWPARTPPPYFPHRTQSSGILSPLWRSPHMSLAGTSPYGPRELSEGKSKSGCLRIEGVLELYLYLSLFTESVMDGIATKISNHFLLTHDLLMEVLKLSVSICVWLYNTHFVHTNSKGHRMRQDETWFKLLIL